MEIIADDLGLEPRTYGSGGGRPETEIVNSDAALRHPKNTFSDAFVFSSSLTTLPSLPAAGVSGVYAIAGVPGYVKIGRAIDMADRLASMQTGHPVPLRLLAVLSLDPDDEFALHRQWAHLRGHGEWFREDDELRAFVLERRVNPAPGPPIDAPIPLARFDLDRAAEAFRACSWAWGDDGIPDWVGISRFLRWAVARPHRQGRAPFQRGVRVSVDDGAIHVVLDSPLAEAYARARPRSTPQPAWIKGVLREAARRAAAGGEP